MSETGNPNSHSDVDPRELRRMKILADLSDEQLSHLACWGELVQFPANRVVVHQGAPGDCMYLILTGEVLVTITDDGHEFVLGTLEVGDFFGDICLFDEGPRCADVTTKTACCLLKLCKRNFDIMLLEDVGMAARIMVAMMRHVAGRLRKMDHRYADSMLFSRSLNALIPKRK